MWTDDLLQKDADFSIYELLKCNYKITLIVYTY